MTAIEQSLPLTEAERGTLSSKRTRMLLTTLGLGAVSIFLLLLLFASIFIFQVFGLGLITELLFGVAFGLTAVVSAIKFIRFQRDLSDGQKRLVSAPVEAQDIDVPSGGGGASSYNFWVKAGGRKLSVTEQQYYQIKKGDLIQAFVAPRSGTVLGISMQKIDAS